MGETEQQRDPREDDLAGDTSQFGSGDVEHELLVGCLGGGPSCTGKASLTLGDHLLRNYDISAQI